MESCLYEGVVEHRRYGSVEHRFRYRIVMAYLDLAELPAVVGPRGLLWSSRFAPASFLRQDHLGDPRRPLDAAVRDEVQRQGGPRPAGPIRLLTQLRCWGYYFSPLNLYYCYDPAGLRVQSVVAEVSNTPWGERHLYLLWQGNRIADDPLHPSLRMRFRHPKTFHVSPFMDMQAEYAWNLGEPGRRLTAMIASQRGPTRLFQATMSLARQPLSRGSVAWMLAKFPWMTGKTIAAIYYEALRLWIKKAPFFPHPEHTTRSSVLPTHGQAEAVQA